MANIKDLIKSIEAADSSFDEKLAAINQMEETLVSIRAQEEQAVQDNVDLIVEAIKVMERKVENQLEIAKSIVPEKGDKGDKGDRGLDGKNGVDGKDGRDGINGRDGQDGQDGVSVTDAKIDFDGSLIITLSTGQEINVGEVVAPELQEKIKLVTSGGAGTVLPEQAGNANKYLKTSGTTLSWDTLNGSDIDLSSPPTIGNTTPNTGAFTTLSASSTVSGTGFSTYLASPPAIGGTAAAAGTFTTLIGGGGSANYEQIIGGSAGNAVQFQTLGSDTNISKVFQSKGTGAIDLAAGSKGVNISNGGTVTAITRTAGGTGYTVAPTITISAPTTAGGVQATATCTVTAGVVDTSFTITNAGSGYVEQPTITFTPVSGGSGATAYATVGGGSIIRALGSTGTQSLDFYTPSGIISGLPNFRIRDIAAASDTYLMSWGFAGNTALIAQGAANGNLNLAANGTGSIVFGTSGTSVISQLRVTNTTSAVDYVQITGATTASKVVAISAQGSDADVTLSLAPKGAGTIRFGTYTASVLTPTGYITITDSGGTSRRLLVG